MKKRKLLICALFVSLFVSALPGTESFAAGDSGESAAASGLQDENQQRLEEITAMDKDGSIYEIGESDGSLDEAVEVDESGEIITDDQEEVSEEQSEEASEEASEEESEEIVNENARNGIATLSMDPEERSASVLVVNFNTGKGGTTKYSGDGYTSGSYGADAAYLGTDKNGDIRFMLAGVKATVDKDLVELVEYSDVADHVSYYKVSNGKLYHYISQNLNKKTASTINNGPAPSYLKSGTKYYSYDGHYFYDDYSVMSADYQNGSHDSAVNAGEKFTNYFQFLDMNKSTAYSADELESILNKAMKNAGIDPSSSKLTGTAGIFIKYQEKYGVNALLSLGIAINESGWGTSGIANKKNNLFGLNAVDSSPGESANYFETVDDCIREFMDKWMARGYLKDGSWKNYGEFLGNKDEGINVKYASDPYWGEKAAAHAWNLDTLGGSRDYLGLGPSEDKPETEEPEVTDPPAADKPATDKPSDEEQQKPSDEEQQKPSDEEEQKPSDEEQQKPSDEVQQKPSDEEEQKPSDDTADKPSDDAADRPAENKPVTPPASNDAVDTSDEEADKPESKPETAPETKPETGQEADETEEPSDDADKEPVKQPANKPAEEPANEPVKESSNEKTEPSTDKPQVILEYGITVAGVDGTVSAETIEPNTDKYTEYVSAEAVKGKTVLGVFDIKVDGTVDGKAQLTFTVGTEYNGKNVIILHYRDDGSCETFAATVKDGQVTINVDSFSPFVIALDDAGDGTVPTTGVTADPGSLAVIMVFAAALGVTALLKRRSYR
ncbi:MAG TPA: glucosaminidase domain-containing protein [Candidatus Mediterraneibacter quadrami]|uniref:Glucosaminidase domain-containing protein n=1 Tax=Candidatus Mediterraneibacter quadrami TaxID=2838684 RepID=A0A9D2RF75_9FIRM|nr:glucosaminidase domain-containing protein [Candidatus Mediterraneibacter quadrami]